MTQLEEFREQLLKLQERQKEYKARLEMASSAERPVLREKLRVTGQVIRDLREQINHLDPPEQRAARKREARRFNVGMLDYDFFERNDAVWSDLEGKTWEQVQAGEGVLPGTPTDLLQAWLAEGAARMTERQRQFVSAYYNDGLSYELIAEQYGVDRSTVSRVIHRGMQRLREWVQAKRMVQDLSTEQGFDWVSYLKKVPILSDRQRQLLLLLLSKQPHSQDDLAAKLELDKSTVSKGLSKAKATIRALGAAGSPISRPVVQNWETADKYALCIETGMPLYFYYRYCFRDERICGLTRYKYEVARRRQAGMTVEQIAGELGLPMSAARSVCRSVRTAPKVPDTATGNTIGANLDAQTYLALQRLVTRPAGGEGA